MKINGFRTKVVSVPRERGPLGEGVDTLASNFVTLRLTTDDGVEGIGYGGFVSSLMVKALKEAMDALAEQTIGDDPMNNEAINAKLFALAGAVLFLVGRAAPGIYGLRSPSGLDWWGCLPLAAAGAAAGGIWIPAAGSVAPAFSDPMAWAALLVAPAAAEILFRGLVHGSLASSFGIQLSGGGWSISLPALVSSALYALCTGLALLAPLVATRALLASPSLLLPLGGAFAFGLACAMARERSESVLAPIAFHWLCAAGVLVAGSTSTPLG